MNSFFSSSYPRARTLTHPGPVNPVRIQSRQTARARHFRFQLSPGESLFSGLVTPLTALGIECASTTILGGVFDRLQYCTAPPDPNHEAIIAYTAPVESGRTWMVFGNATIAKGRDLQPLVHCHATIRTQAGVLRGGHVIARTAVVGAAPISVLVTALEGFELRVEFDPETNIQLIQPLDVAQGATR
jgi:predicted DNA-binding protein with PD1-like motif